jgi:hypothetical protein
MFQTVFPTNDALFQDDNATIYTAGTVQSWFEVHESEVHQLLWRARSPDLIIIVPLWPVLETRTRNRFPPPTSIYNFMMFFRKNDMNSSRDCSKFVRVHSKKVFGCIEGERWSNNILMCKVSLVFPLFCPDPLHSVTERSSSSSYSNYCRNLQADYHSLPLLNYF